MKPYNHTKGMYLSCRDQEYNMAVSDKPAPQFYHIAHYESLSKDTLALVRRLYIHKVNRSSRYWFPDLISKLTSLEEVMIFVTVQPDIGDMGHIFPPLLKHKNRPRVHADLDLNTFHLSSLEYLRKKENGWSAFRKLNVQSLTIEYSLEEVKFPKFFFAIVKGFTSLKKLKFFQKPDYVGMAKDNKKYGGDYPLYYLTRLLKHFPNFEELDIGMPPHHFEWPVFSRLTKLLVPLWVFKKRTTFENFDTVTHLELFRSNCR